MRRLVLVVILALISISSGWAQQATVDWTHVHQIIDGFGATAPFIGDGNRNLTSAQQDFFFGSGNGQLGLSILRVGVTDGHSSPGDCSNVSVSCAGSNVDDMLAAVAKGARIYASPWSPPAAYKTNASVSCKEGGGNGSIRAAAYGAYATWLGNFVKSLKTESNISVYALSLQNEPDMCVSYDSAVWSSAQFDRFVGTQLGPSFASAGLSTLIFAPETSRYSELKGVHGAGTCMKHAACSRYIGGISFHDYDAIANSSHSENETANPWNSLGEKYWETEASCGDGYGPSGCEHGFATDMPGDGLLWAGLIDDRLVRANVNAYLYWALLAGNKDNEGLETTGGVIPKRAYVFGQYSRFVRPGYHRIEVTHKPQSGVSVSAYRDTSTGTLVVIATNYARATKTQAFSVINAPRFATVSPYITSPSRNIEAESPVSLSGNAFSYALPASSVTTFVGISTGP